MATKGTKVRLEFGNGADVASSTTWTPIAKIVDISPPQITADDIDVSNMDSPGADEGKPFRQFDPGWADAGEVELTIQFEKNQQETLFNLHRTPKGWRMMFPDAPHPSGSRWMLDGYIRDFGNTVDREGIIQTTIVMKISGEPEFIKAA